MPELCIQIKRVLYKDGQVHVSEMQANNHTNQYPIAVYHYNYWA